jgi:hypothetical protein
LTSPSDGIVFDVFGNVGFDNVGTILAGKGEHFHGNEIDDRPKGFRNMRRTGTDGKSYDYRLGTKSVFDLVERSVKVRSFAIHFIDEGDAGNVIFVCLPPDGFALGFDTLAGGKNDDTAVKNTQRAFDFGSEIDVPRRVDEVERVVFPVKSNGGGLNGNASFLFFGIVVGNGGALIDHTDFVDEVGVEEHSFGNGRLSCIDMGDDSDISERL